MIKLKNISKSFGDKEVLKNISCELTSGNTYALLGRNGVGKTTLLKILARKNFATEGSVEHELLDNDRLSICCHFDPIEYVNHMQSYSKVEGFLKDFENFLPEFDFEYSLELLSKFNIDKNTKLKKITLAQKSLVTVIATLASNQKILIFDEPVQLLTADLRDIFYKELITVISKEETITIISTHIINEIENIVSDVLILKDTELVVDDKVDNLKEKHNLSLENIFVKVVE